METSTRHLRLLLAVAVAFVFLNSFSHPIAFGLLDYPWPITIDTIADMGWIVVLGAMSPLLPALLGYLLWCKKAGPKAVSKHRPTAWLWAVAIGAIVAFTLNLTDILPYSWKWPEYDRSATYTYQMLRHHDWIGLGMLTLQGVLITPLLEEQALRRSVVGLLAGRFGAMTAVIGSSTLFAVLHLNLYSFDAYLLRKVILYFLLSIPLALMLLRRPSTLLPVGIHAGFNLTTLMSAGIASMQYIGVG